MKLTVKVDNSWKYVFCRGMGFNGELNNIITTKDKRKAIQGTKDSLDYFHQHFPEFTFSIRK